MGIMIFTAVMLQPKGRRVPGSASFDRTAVGALRPDQTRISTSENYRLWELAGHAHGDQWVAFYFLQSMGWYLGGVKTTFDEQDAGRYGEEGGPGGCIPLPQADTPAPWPIGRIDGVGRPDELDHMYAMDAAIFHLNRWARGGAPPPEAPVVEIDASGAIARDAHGNALGGVQQPILEVPVAVYRGDECFLFGQTTPFDPVKLGALYPSHQDYVCKLEAAVDGAVGAGFMRPADAEDLMERAAASRVGGDLATGPCALSSP